MGLNTYKILLSLERLGYKFDNCQAEVKQHRNCVSPWKGHEKSFDLVVPSTKFSNESMELTKLQTWEI